jgi:hypothetical protein
MTSQQSFQEPNSAPPRPCASPVPIAGQRQSASGQRQFCAGQSPRHFCVSLVMVSRARKMLMTLPQPCYPHAPANQTQFCVIPMIVSRARKMLMTSR